MAMGRGVTKFLFTDMNNAFACLTFLETQLKSLHPWKYLEIMKFIIFDFHVQHENTLKSLYPRGYQKVRRLHDAMKLILIKQCLQIL